MVKGPRKTRGRNPVAESCEDYEVGQVASSLFQNKSAACDSDVLRDLFSTPLAEKQPTYVAVAKESKKRHHKEEEVITEIQDSSTKKQPFKKTKKSKTDTSLANETVANREYALAHVSEAEGEVIQMKNRLFPGSEETAQMTRKKLRMNLAKEKLKNKRTLFVGNLPVSYTAQMLKAFFKDYGQIESIRFRSLIPGEDAISKKMAAIKQKLHPNMKYVNAYVVFKEESAANSALECNGTEITRGFHIRVDLASKSTCHDNKRSIFVGNLPYEIDDDILRNHFLECGNVTGIRIVRDRNTGVGKGFGYVLFETTDAVHLALKLNQSELQGRKLRVQRCVQREKEEQKKSHKSEKSSIRLKHTKTTLKKTKGSSNSFVGEKADPVKKSKKSKSRNNMKMRTPK
ncbi:RNA-binding protein 34 isoform X2 [Erythrolamprus reginae]|uniref:RNA-binding protein 34 isoform X2 n=1 Tax=Erythrolamprus reginae TaxID=121349 RepID=UPI00396CFCB8